MKILVTGAKGFTGRHFIRAAMAAGHVVVPLWTDLRDKNALGKDIQKVAPDAVVHLAALSFVGHENPNTFYDVNVVGTLNLLDALTQLPYTPHKILLASSANVYGNCAVSPISEDVPAAPLNHYATSKLAMEFMARTYSDRLPLFFTRPFNYTGPGQSQSFIIPKLVGHYCRREPTVELGNLDVEREFNDVRFVCEAYLRLLENCAAGEVVNICSGTPITLRSVISLLKDLTGHQLEVRVNNALVRPNEIRTLCGDPRKLHSIVGSIDTPSFIETLDWMQATYGSENF